MNAVKWNLVQHLNQAACNLDKSNLKLHNKHGYSNSRSNSEVYVMQNTETDPWGILEQCEEGLLLSEVCEGKGPEMNLLEQQYQAAHQAQEDLYE